MLKMINKTACTESAVELKVKIVSKKRELIKVKRVNDSATKRNIES